MPNPKGQAPVISSAKLERKSRLSLQEKEKSPNTAVAGNRRNTISEDSLPRVRKKSKPPLTPTIPEDENETAEKDTQIVIVNERQLNRSSSTTSKRSAMSSKPVRSSFTYDNGAYEGNLKITTTSEVRPMSRTPSVRSLEVVREQYCCCAKRTKCERYLLVTVTILSIIVIVLVVVVAVLSSSGSFENYKMFNVSL